MSGFLTGYKHLDIEGKEGLQLAVLRGASLAGASGLADGPQGRGVQGVLLP